MSTELMHDSRPGSSFAVQPHSAGNGHSSATAAMIAREAHEVQAAMVMAKQFPRDIIQAERRILDACKRRRLAEQAMYAYPRGGTTVTGPSIRLAEVLAQNWGNISVGIKEVSQKAGVSEVMAVAWDLETGFQCHKVFPVKHERHKRNGVVEKLTDPRDIYELVANQGARRLRACILGVIPGDIVDAAVEECEKTLAGGNSEPLIDRIKKLVTAFEQFGVTKPHLEKKLGHNLEAIIEAEFVTLRKIYKSLQDGMAKAEDFFHSFDRSKPANESLQDLEKNILETPAKAPVKSDAPTKAAPHPTTVDMAEQDRLDMQAQDFVDAIKDATTPAAIAKIEAEIKPMAAELGEKRMELLNGLIRESKAKKGGK